MQTIRFFLGENYNRALWFFFLNLTDALLTWLPCLTGEKYLWWEANIFLPRNPTIFLFYKFVIPILVIAILGRAKRLPFLKWANIILIMVIIFDIVVMALYFNLVSYG